MRINIYGEELTDRLEIVEKTDWSVRDQLIGNFRRAIVEIQNCNFYKSGE